MVFIIEINWHKRKKVTDVSKSSECLTCNSTIEIPHVDPALNSVPLISSEYCLYHAASFSTNGDYYVLECLGDRIPITYVKSTEDKKLECMLKHLLFLRRILKY